MNRILHKPLGSLEIDVVTVYGTFAVGGAGACTLTVADSKGVATAVHTSTGKYTITLSEPCYKFLWAQAVILDSTLSNPTSVGCFATVFSQAVNNATPTVVFQFVNFTDGSAADPHSGAVVYFKLEMRNSSVG